MWFYFYLHEVTFGFLILFSRLTYCKNPIIYTLRHCYQTLVQVPDASQNQESKMSEFGAKKSIRIETVLTEKMEDLEMLQIHLAG